MQFTRTSPFSGITRTLDLPVTESQLESWNQGTLIQDAFPQLSSEEREFIKTGITDAEWEEFVADCHYNGNQIPYHLMRSSE